MPGFNDCDECAKDVGFTYFRVIYFGNLTDEEPAYGNLERIFCSPECMRKYFEEW